MFFQTYYDEIELLKNQLWHHFSDVIVITTTKTSPNLRHKIFLFGPLSIKIFGYASD